MAMDYKECTLTIGKDSTLVLRHSRSSTPIIAKCLGVNRDSNGNIIKVWADRMLHPPGVDNMGKWNVSGAISTIFEVSDHS